MSLQLEAIKGAIADAGLTIDDIDGIMPFDRVGYGTSMFAEQSWATQLGGRTLSFAEPGSPSSGLAKAAMAISAGMCNVAGAFWGKAGWKPGTGGPPGPHQAPPGMEGGYALFCGGHA